MHQYRAPVQPLTWKERIIRSRYFVIALLLHLIIFFLVATLVIWKAPEVPNDTFKGVTVNVKPPPPPPSANASAGDAAMNPQFEPQPVVVPVVTPPSVITSVTSDFHLDTPKILDQSLSRLSTKMPQGSGLTAGGGNSGSGGGNGLFGSFSGTGNELQGTVFDLKIDPNHKPTNMNADTYNGLLRSFLSKGWDPGVFSPYYKASKSLFTPAIWIPTTVSDECADKMHLDNELSPSFWVGWYHAKVTPAKAGKYHFIGFGDDILVVAINGQVVFDGSISPVTGNQPTIPWGYQDWCVTNPYRENNYAKLRAGSSFEVNNVESVTVDVLMGDEPGFYYCAYLLIADESQTYTPDSHGVPLYPIFQLGTDPVHRSGDLPPHATDPVSWSAQ